MRPQNFIRSIAYYIAHSYRAHHSGSCWSLSHSPILVLKKVTGLWSTFVLISQQHSMHVCRMKYKGAMFNRRIWNVLNFETHLFVMQGMMQIIIQWQQYRDIRLSNSTATTTRLTATRIDSISGCRRLLSSTWKRKTCLCFFFVSVFHIGSTVRNVLSRIGSSTRYM